MNVDQLIDRMVVLSGDCELLISARAFKGSFTVYAEIDENDESIAPLKARLHTFATKGGEVLRQMLLDNEPAVVDVKQRQEIEDLVSSFKAAVTQQQGSSDRYYFAVNVEPHLGGRIR